MRSHRLLAALLPLALLPLAPGALAGSADAPEMTDPSGDAHPTGWLDLTAAWFADETAEAITVNLMVANHQAPPDGIAYVLFRVGEQHYFAGYAKAVFLPGALLDNGFLCPSDAQGSPTGDCPELEGRFANGVYSVVVPRALIGATQAGAVIEAPHGEAGNFVGGLHWQEADRTDTGAAYTFVSGELPEVPAEAPAAPLETQALGPRPAPQQAPAAPAPPRATPGIAALPALGLALLVLALMARKR